MPSYTAQVPSGRPSCLLENENHPLQTGADTLTSCKSDEEERDPPPDRRPHHGLVSLHQPASLLTAICQLMPLPTPQWCRLHRCQMPLSQIQQPGTGGYHRLRADGKADAARKPLRNTAPGAVGDAD